jgi:hypothetical protein
MILHGLGWAPFWAVADGRGDTVVHCSSVHMIEPGETVFNNAQFFASQIVKMDEPELVHVHTEVVDEPQHMRRRITTTRGSGHVVSVSVTYVTYEELEAQRVLDHVYDGPPSLQTWRRLNAAMEEEGRNA